MMERRYAMRTIDTIYIDGAFVTPQSDDKSAAVQSPSGHS
jgi:hypothetical protein